MTPQIRDFVLYLTGSLVVALVAVIRLPVFTNHFTPADFGIFSLVFITYTYLSMVLYNWLSSCIYRFYNEYRENGKQAELYSNIMFLFLAASLALLLVSVTWFLLAGSREVRHLVIPAFCFLFTNQVFSMFLVMYKLQGKALNYNLYQVVQSVFSFLLILVLIFSLDQHIEAIFTGQVLVTGMLLIVMILNSRKTVRRISSVWISWTMIMKLIHYGSVGFISAAGIFILISSDRYIIALFEDISQVGIYNQIYQVGQVSVYFLVTVFFNAITPGFNKLLTGFVKEREKPLVEYIKIFLILLMPVTFYVSLFDRQVAEFLLGPEFRQGYTLIPWIVSGSFLYGLTLFNETKMKFEQKFKPVVRGIVAASILNVCLNFLLIPRLGYTAAAVTTFVAYLFLFLYYYVMDDFQFLKDSPLVRIILVSASVLAVQGLADLLIRRIMGFDLNKWLTLAEAIVFLGIYAGIMIRLKLFRLSR